MSQVAAATIRFALSSQGPQTAALPSSKQQRLFHSFSTFIPGLLDRPPHSLFHSFAPPGVHSFNHFRTCKRGSTRSQSLVRRPVGRCSAAATVLGSVHLFIHSLHFAAAAAVPLLVCRWSEAPSRHPPPPSVARPPPPPQPQLVEFHSSPRAHRTVPRSDIIRHVYSAAVVFYFGQYAPKNKGHGRQLLLLLPSR